jgi:hypothetical protein
MITKLEIANQALRELKINAVQSLESNEAVSNIVSESIDWSIRSVLTDKNWSYSTKSFVLSPSLEYTDNTGKYIYTFELPHDVDHVIKVLDEAFDLVPDYQLSGTLIHSNMKKLVVNYVSFDTELTNISHTIASLISLHLAKSLCFRLTENADLKASLDQRYQVELSSASAKDARQKPLQKYITESTSQFLGAHNGYGSI